MATEMLDDDDEVKNKQLAANPRERGSGDEGTPKASKFICCCSVNGCLVPTTTTTNFGAIKRSIENGSTFCLSCGRDFIMYHVRNRNPIKAMSAFPARREDGRQINDPAELT